MSRLSPLVGRNQWKSSAVMPETTDNSYGIGRVAARIDRGVYRRHPAVPPTPGWDGWSAIRMLSSTCQRVFIGSVRGSVR